jgi:hypothetical protein
MFCSKIVLEGLGDARLDLFLLLGVDGRGLDRELEVTDAPLDLLGVLFSSTQHSK